MRRTLAFALALATATASTLPIGTCKFPNTARNGQGVALGFPRIANRMRSTGVVNFTILFADFSDAISPDTPAEVFARMNPAGPYYEELSYGKMQPVLSPLLKTLRMPRPSTSYSPSSRQYFLDATALAVQEGWNFTMSDSIVIMTSSTATHLTNGPAMCARPGGGFSVQGKVFENGATSGYDFKRWGPRWFNHEIGHTMALCYQFNWEWNEFPYTGDWSLMSDIAGSGNHYFSWEKWLLGWLDDAEVSCVGAGATRINLAPLESLAATPGGSVRSAVIPTTSNTRGVFVEARSNIGGDTGIPQPGCLCAVIDTSVSTGEGPIRVLAATTPSGNMLRATLTAGKSLVFEGVNVTCTTVGADGNMVADIVSACTPINCPAPGTCQPDGSCSA